MESPRMGNWIIKCKNS